MGMFDEIYCYAPLPDNRFPPGTCYQTKSIPEPCMCRYRITSVGRLIDSAGNDLEPEGYITFYTLDRRDDDGNPLADRHSILREYRARFLSGQLQGIVRVTEDAADRTRYGLASFRWFQTPSFLLDESDDVSEASKLDVGVNGAAS